VMHAIFRAVIELLLWIAHDRCDIAYAVKEAASALAKPLQHHWIKAKRIVRYLKRFPRSEQLIEATLSGEGSPWLIRVRGDSDWSGELEKRRSTSGCSLMLLECQIHHHSRTQHAISLSSGEAETDAGTSAAVEGMFVSSVVDELGFANSLVLETDSSAFQMGVQKPGLGKMKHIQIRHNWLKQSVADKRLRVDKIPRDINTSDLMTCPVTEQVLDKFLKMLNIKRAEKDSKKEEEVSHVTAARRPAAVPNFITALMTLLATLQPVSGQGDHQEIQEAGWGAFYIGLILTVGILLLTTWWSCRRRQEEPEEEPIPRATRTTGVQTEVQPVVAPPPPPDPLPAVVYVTQYGECYHTRTVCRGLRNANGQTPKRVCLWCLDVARG